MYLSYMQPNQANACILMINYDWLSVNIALWLQYLSIDSRVEVKCFDWEPDNLSGKMQFGSCVTCEMPHGFAFGSTSFWSNRQYQLIVPFVHHTIHNMLYYIIYCIIQNGVERPISSPIFRYTRYDYLYINYDLCTTRARCASLFYVYFVCERHTFFFVAFGWISNKLTIDSVPYTK